MIITSVTIADVASANDVRIDADALKFAQQHKLVEHLKVAMQLAAHHFKPIEPIWVELMIDPEADWDKLVLNVVVVGSGDTIMERYNAFGGDFVDAIPSDARHLISLIPDIRSPG